MKRVRGIIALLVAVALGLLSVQVVSHYLNKPRVKKKKNIEKKSEKQHKGPVAEIPAGMRVFPVSLKEMPGVKRGDRVDVIATTPLPGKAEGMVSRIILENIEVFGTETGSGKGSRYARKKVRNAVSLLLRPEQAGILAAALKTADLTLVRRRNDDLASCSESGAVSFIYSRGAGPVISYGRGRDFSRIVPEGKRAITIRVKDTDGLCGVLRPGDMVDIIITCPYSRFASRGLSPGAEGQVTQYRIGARLLAQDIEVLANEATLMPGSDPVVPVRNVTLAVTPRQAVILTASTEATKKGSIKLVLRRRDDKEKLDLRPVHLADILTEKRMFKQVELVKGSQVIEVPFFR